MLSDKSDKKNTDESTRPQTTAALMPDQSERSSLSISHHAAFFQGTGQPALPVYCGNSGYIGSTFPTLATVLNVHLSRRASQGKVHKILIIGENYEDGIGDFFHLYDFYKYFSEKFKDSTDIKIKCIVFVDDKNLKKIENILGDDFSESIFKFPSNENEPGVNSQENQFVCVSTTEMKAQEMETSAFLEKETLQTTGAVLFYSQMIENFSNSPVTSSLKKILDNNPELFMYGIGEYGKITERMCINGNLYTSHGMGFLPWQAGIKFNPMTSDSAGLVDQHASDNCRDRIKIKALRRILAQDADTFIGCGYIQDKFFTSSFILSCAAMSAFKAGSRSTTLLVNTDYYRQIFSPGKKYLIPEYVQDELKCRYNICKIQILSASGELLHDTALSSNNGVGGKVLYLVHFPGASQTEKEHLLQASDCVAASGDNSFSEMLDSGAFPFFALPKWKTNFLKQIIADVDVYEDEISFEELQEYLARVEDRTIGNEKNWIDRDINISDYIATHYKKIAAQWQIYVSHISAGKYRSYHLNKSLDAFADMSVISSIVHTGDEKEKSALFQQGPEVIVSAAVRHGDETVLRRILDAWPAGVQHPNCVMDWIEDCLPPRGAGSCLHILLTHPILSKSVRFSDVVEYCLNTVVTKENVKKGWFCSQSSWITSISPRNSALTECIMDAINRHQFSPQLDVILKTGIASLLAFETNNTANLDVFIRHILDGREDPGNIHVNAAIARIINCLHEDDLTQSPKIRRIQ